MELEEMATEISETAAEITLSRTALEEDRLQKPALERAINDDRGLGFDDVLLVPQYSEVNPNEVSMETRFSRNIPLKIPLVSSPMDTVTEYELAIKLAEEGGIGIIHRNLDPEKQASEVAKVKRRLNKVIERPETAYGDETVETILKKIEKNKWSFHSFPVVNREHTLIGILTADSFSFCDDVTQKIEDIVKEEFEFESEGFPIEQAYELMKRQNIRAIPLVNERHEPTKLYVWSDLKRILSKEAHNYNTDDNQQLRVGAAVGVYDDAFARAELLIPQRVDVIVIDTAHGDTKGVIETTKILKSEYGNKVDIVAGNISTAEGTKRLIEAGVDGLREGQGSGAACTTWDVSGTGSAPLTGLYESAKKARKYGITVCADGGLRTPGDIVKAIAAGADSAMLGSMLAGTEEAPGEMIFVDGAYWKIYRGMGSKGAMKERGGRDRYHQVDVPIQKQVPEGIEGRVQYKGYLNDIVNQYIGGIKSGMGYNGAKSIKELKEKGYFKLISRPTSGEPTRRGMIVTSETPFGESFGK